MQSVTTIGLDIAKSVFQVHGVDAEGNVKSRRWNHAEIDRRDSVPIVAEECLPGLRRRLLTSHHILGDSRLSDLEVELQQFAMDPRCSPQGIFFAHSSDEIAQFPVDLGPACTVSGLPAPVGSEPCPMPPQDGVRLNKVYPLVQDTRLKREFCPDISQMKEARPQEGLGNVCCQVSALCRQAHAHQSMFLRAIQLGHSAPP